MRARKACVLPAPDSPMTPRQRPAPSSKETSSTAVFPPYATPSPSTDSSASLTAVSQSPSQRISQCVECRQQRDQQARRRQQHPRRGFHFLRALVDQTTEAGVRLLHAQPEEAQEAL